MEKHVKTVTLYFNEENDIVGLYVEQNGYDKDCDVKIFDPEKFYGQSLGGFVRDFCNPRTDVYCKHCGKELSPSTIDGYAFQCFDCDEDFYEFEVVSKDEEKDTQV